MSRTIILIAFLVLYTGSDSGAREPLWQGKGRIVISSDGNEHDHDDWAATPLSLALLASAGLQDRLTLYTYSDHIWGSNQGWPTSKSGLNAYEHMRESALGAQKWFGFDSTRFICAVDNAEVAGEAIARADKNKLRYVSLVSHSQWNNNHSDQPASQRKKNPKYWDVHSGWTFKEIGDTFGTDKGGGVNMVQIMDQNGGKDYDGLNTHMEKFDWIKTSPARNNPCYREGSWDWLYSRQETCIKNKGKNFDPSDAGMIVFLLTGIEKTNPDMVRELMENPVCPQ